MTASLLSLPGIARRTIRQGSNDTAASTAWTRCAWVAGSHRRGGRGGGGAFAYTAGWLSPQRLTPTKVVQAFAPPGGPALGHRRNHVKGICFIGTFDANGAGTVLSKAPMFVRGQYPIVGRFNLGTANLNAPEASVRVRGMGLQITAPGGETWRTAMIIAP